MTPLNEAALAKAVRDACGSIFSSRSCNYPECRCEATPAAFSAAITAYLAAVEAEERAQLDAEADRLVELFETKGAPGTVDAVLANTPPKGMSSPFGFITPDDLRAAMARRASKENPNG